MKNTNLRNIAALLLSAGLIATLAGCASADQQSPTASEKTQALEISDGWVRVSEMTESEGGMTGAFATITNTSEEDITLIAGDSDVAGVVEIHEVVMVDGEMKMQPISGGIVIPAGQSVTLEPGGLHVMLMDLTRPLVEGEDISITLKFDGNEDITVSWPTRVSMSGDEEYHSHDSDMNGDGSMEENSDHDH